MKKNPNSKTGAVNLRAFLGLLLGSLGVVLGMSSLTGPESSKTSTVKVAPRFASSPLTQTHLDAMPSFVRGPIEATLQWMESFKTASEPRRSIMPTLPANSKTSSQGISAMTPIISEAVVATVSPALRDLPAANAFSASITEREEGELSNRTPQFPRNPLEHDSVVQSTTAPTVGMPPVGVSFEGMENNQACNGCIPPDPNGAVGPNHYVQMVNSSLAVYDKTGAVISSPKAINTLWSLTPNSECFQNNNGDPIVIYDQLADRWLISEFVASAVPNYAECVAVSTSPDPTGSYYLYEFDESTGTFHDYPHIGVWPDGYYMSTNLFPNTTTTVTSTGAGAWAFERPKMLLGQPARYIFFDETNLATQTYTPGGQLPTSLEGRNPPPAGAPNYFVEVDDTNTPDAPPATTLHDEMHIWQFHVDWTNPANSTFGTGSSAPAATGFPGQFAGNAGQPSFILPIADYVPVPCQFASGPTCIPEKATPGQPTEYLEALGDRLMYRVTYRNFGDHESLLVSHTAEGAADQPDGSARAGVRWYELRGLSTTPTVYQQSTFAPLDPTNPLWRWMGSAAMDHAGDIAIGYSASGPNYFPSLHYAGRLASDPLSDLTQGEAVLFQGSGIQVAVPNYLQRNRWGDYSNLTVDPSDDCTFWYTNEYLATNGIVDVVSTVEWHTRIGSFKFPQCAAVTPPQLLNVFSEKVHGSAGTFDLNLPLDGSGVEPRTGGSGGDFTLIFHFANPITSAGTCSAAPCTSCSSSPGSDQHDYVLNLHGCPNAQRATPTLTSVIDSAGNFGDVSLVVGFLLGDTNGDGFVNSADISQTKAQSGQTVTSSNFREDVNADGFLNSADISLVKSKSGTALP